MTMYFVTVNDDSKELEACLLSDVHTIPVNAIEVEKSVWLEMTQSRSDLWVSGKDGFVRSARPVELPSAEEQAISERLWRDAELLTSDGLVARHRDEVEADEETTLTAAFYKKLQEYRKALRLWPEHESFPDSKFRPSYPV